MAIRITQSGVALTVGIIVLTGLIIGGFFIVKNSGEQARREDAIKVAEQNLQEQSNNGVALNENSDSVTNESTETTEDTPAKEETATESTTPSTQPDTSSSTQATNELPQTGPVDQLVNLLAVTLLTFSGVSYVASQRQVA